MLRRSHSKVQSRAMMLTAVPPPIVPTDNVVCGGSKPLSGRARGAPLGVQPADFEDDLGGGGDRVDAALGRARMPLPPGDPGAEERQPFCRLATCIEVGSPTIAIAGRASPSGKARISAGAPKQPVSSSWVKARCSGTVSAPHRLRHQRQGEGDKALHVGGAAAIEPAVPLGQRERVAVPFLAGHRHDIGMAGQDDAAALGPAAGRSWRRGWPCPRRRCCASRQCRAARDSRQTQSISSRFERAEVVSNATRRSRISTAGASRSSGLSSDVFAGAAGRGADHRQDLAPGRSGRCGRRRACGWSPC